MQFRQLGCVRPRVTAKPDRCQSSRQEPIDIPCTKPKIFGRDT